MAGTTNIDYNCPPHLKKILWGEIIEAAKVVIAKGGAGIRFRPCIEDSERLQREMRYGTEEE